MRTTEGGEIIYTDETGTIREDGQLAGFNPLIAPTWVFEPSALEEIGKFIDSMSPEESMGILRSVDPPRYVMFELRVPGTRGGLTGIFGRTRDIRGPNYVAPPADEGKARSPFSLVWYDLPDSAKADRDGLDNATAIVIEAICVRTLFKDRFIERLTKHQERALRRYGQLSDTKRIISVAWDAPTPTYIEALDRLTRPPEPTHDRGPVCRHDVRGHARHMRSGKVVWVTAHQRGDPNVPRKTITRITGHVG